MGSIQSKLQKATTDNDPSDCRIDSGYCHVQQFFGACFRDAGANISVMNAQARITQCQISVSDPRAHISMVASLEPFLFPWEDADEFDALHRSLQDEWEPSGALEEDAVYTILTCIWRKRRIRDKRNLDTLAALQQKDLKELSETPLPFFDTKLEKNIYALSNRPKSDGSPRYADKVSQLIGFSSSLYGKLDGQFLELMIGMLGKEFSTHLKREVPKENYPTTPEWVQAVKREVDEVLLPRARAEMESPDHLAGKAAEFITTDRILEDLTLEERLDAMVDRAMRRLAQMKFMKQISASSERLLNNTPPLQIEGPRKPKREKTKK